MKKSVFMIVMVTVFVVQQDGREIKFSDLLYEVNRYKTIRKGGKDYTHKYSSSTLEFILHLWK